MAGIAFPSEAEELGGGLRGLMSRDCCDGATAVRLRAVAAEVRGDPTAGPAKLVHTRIGVAPKRRDILLLSSGPAQFHLGIWTGHSLIHADAGLRRVVETPGWPRWPLISAWMASGRRR